jgi:hypothetical protein
METLSRAATIPARDKPLLHDFEPRSALEAAGGEPRLTRLEAGRPLFFDAIGLYALPLSR